MSTVSFYTIYRLNNRSFFVLDICIHSMNLSILHVFEDEFDYEFEMVTVQCDKPWNSYLIAYNIYQLILILHPSFERIDLLWNDRRIIAKNVMTLLRIRLHSIRYPERYNCLRVIMLLILTMCFPL